VRHRLQLKRQFALERVETTRRDERIGRPRALLPRERFGTSCARISAAMKLAPPHPSPAKAQAAPAILTRGFDPDQLALPFTACGNVYLKPSNGAKIIVEARG
jgi:hypothetical protein